MKQSVVVVVCAILLTLGAEYSYCQLEDLQCASTGSSAPESYFAGPNIVRRGGKSMTTQGVLRVLVVYVRFQDDERQYGEWPYYQLLPDYAQYFVDQQVPGPGGAYTPGNFSDFIDRASGGDGNGTLGALKMTGDVYYVTTDQGKLSYANDAAVCNHVMQKLDSPPYNVNFALYDNWTFQSGGYFVHSNVPDGTLDWTFINWRDCSRSYPCRIGGVARAWADYTSNDYNTNGQLVRVRDWSGGTQYRMYEWGGPFDAIDGRRARAIYYPGGEFFCMTLDNEAGLNIFGRRNFSSSSKKEYRECSIHRA